MKTASTYSLKSSIPFIHVIRLFTFLVFCNNGPDMCAQGTKSSLTAANYYEFDGIYSNTNEELPFEANLVTSARIYEGSDNNQNLNWIQTHHSELDWQDVTNIIPEEGKVYWLHTSLRGSQRFYGTQLFYISPESLSGVFSFDQIDQYIVDDKGITTHFQTGYQTALADRPLHHWAHMMKVDILPSETLELYLRLDGVNASAPIPNIRLWHLNQASVFPEQVYRGIRVVLFFGIIGVQFFFFLSLFFIGKEKLHLYFSILLLGLFLNRGFVGNNHMDFVPFPYWFDHHAPLFVIGLFFAQLGALLFTKEYLKFDSKSFFSRRILNPFIVLITGLHGTIAIFQLMDWGLHHSGFQYILTDIAAVTTCLLLFYMLYTVTHISKKEKRLYLIALSPLILAVFVNIMYDHNFLFVGNDFIVTEIYMRVAIIFMVTAFGLIIGYRTNNLKNEKEVALKQNLINQQLISENKLRATHLEEINQIKTQFYTNITHEFRTPLTVIMGITEEMKTDTEVLQFDNQSKQKLKNRLSLVNRNSNNLLQLVNQLLELSKADSKMLKLNLKQGDIISYLNYLTESFYSAAKDKDIRLVFYSEVDSLIMAFDEMKVQQLVFNLLSNALKFTEARGKIVFHVQMITNRGAQCLQLKFSDTGIGIAQEEIPHLFERFYQGDRSQTHIQQGTGIGLALTKELVELMEGSIQVSSQIGKGSVFSILLPVDTENQAVEGMTIRDTPPYLVPITTTPMKGLQVQEASAFQVDVTNMSGRPRILLIEDSADVATYISGLLSDAFDIKQVHNGQLGISSALEDIPDLIITDVMMPVKDGFDVCQQLKTDIRTSHIPIIMLTAKADIESKLEGLQHGADAYLTKPFHKEELLIRIKSLLELRQKLQAYYLNFTKDSLVQIGIQKNDIETENGFVKDIRLCIETNFDDYHFSVEKLCKHVNMSQSNFYRKITALTGLSPKKYINHIKLLKAKQLLLDSHLTINTIAYELGYNDPGYFGRLFKKEFGESPEKWRQSKRPVLSS